ncbi:Protein PHOTOPERIOD-INDEPENDENT EARLY FLOWERING like [Actinidia chinensis var. chinensis]|uniref:Protein PHOTOPERIOD-INDEPENDENT EARLY FLOWERING like n=1 Tax=Actinidia chinensis var. chinensis TaxID=1590841 RepID=A0A2R6RT86_ACTCC|nr:Protein PHOTOPERIOD-INDEPENDENT EARLY FLOWERING like [Actinidia chinensis var. chinensis]
MRRCHLGATEGRGGGRGTIRMVRRAITAGAGGASQEPIPHCTAEHRALRLSPCSSPTYSDDFDWECIDGTEDDRENVSDDDSVFGSVPTNDEVQHALSSLQQAFDQTSFSQFMKGRLAHSLDKDVADEIASPTATLKRVSSVGKKLDWIEPSLHLCNPGLLQRRGYDRVYDAFHLLHTEPSIQRMVMSLSSDKAVWNAVLNNEVVRGLRESLVKADKSVPENTDNSSGGPNAVMDILSGIFENTKAKVMEIIEKVIKLVNELFQPSENEKTRGATDPFEDKLRTLSMLSIVVLLIVVVSRVHSA